MIYQGDCVNFLLHCKPFHCIFADIPDNINLGYHGYVDRMDERYYKAFVRSVIVRSLQKSNIFWLTYNQVHDTWIKAMLANDPSIRDQPFEYKQLIWIFTFGQYQDDGFTNCYRPLLCFVKQGVSLNYNGIRITSARMELGDKRAAGPRVPSDVWEFARVVGNAAERRAWHVTQLPEAMMSRILILSCMKTENGRTEGTADVCDLCLGSGTTAVMAKRLGIPWTGVEISKFYCGELAKLLQAPVMPI